ncbi:sphingosine-1-phosphate lyase [[Candida] anglica]|uniref:sphinganine-1-phosphate aldolase n=1 Tax=[Candida] anglica TaxID=148631 RepID=A0ABP0ECU0_9ASCO
MEAQEMDALLSGHIYGQPYMPQNVPQFVFLVKSLFKLKLNSWRLWFVEEIYHSNEFPFNLFPILCTFIVTWWLLGYFKNAVRTIRGYGIVTCIQMVYKKIASYLFKIVLSLPPLKNKVDSEVASTTIKIESDIIRNSPNLLQFPGLPKTGISKDAVLSELESLHDLKHTDWARGRVSGAVYHGGEDLTTLQTQAYHKNSVANQLHPDVFPGVRKMEAEVVSMVLKIFNAPETGCGSSTSGGTESLLLAGLAAREYGKRYKGIHKPEIIAPVTIHAGIEKACYYFGMKLHKVKLDPTTFQVDIPSVKRLINSNTVLLVGSAPNFPHGIIDDIEELSKLAVKYKIPLHVDACLGSFIVTFLEKSKVHGDSPIPKFDFRLPGVTSISCDTHKYGFAPKGSSIIMYRDPKLRECQYYVSTDWTGGMYGSPTLAGSRPGALMAGCWATLVSIGEKGYSDSCFDIVSASMKLKNVIRSDPVLSKRLDVIGEPIGSVISFKIADSSSKLLNIYTLGDLLTKKGWHFSTLQSPAALHFALTRLTVPIIDELIEDLVNTVEELVAESEKSNEKIPESEIGALYGVAGSVQTAGVADRLIVAFLDSLYKI